MGRKKRADLYVDVDDFFLEVDDFLLEVMGHDINNLNQVILANLELLQESNRLEASQDEFLESAILATKDCASTVKNVRALQGIAAGAVETRDVDLDRVIRESIGEVPRPAGKRIVIRYTPLQETPGTQGTQGTPGKDMIVKAMPKLKLAISNLVGNAIKYSGPVVHIDITVSEKVMEAAAGRKCLITIITDDGNGIPDSVKEKLFARPGQDAAVLHGQRLGLCTAKAMAEASAGWLKVEDRVPGDHTKGTKVSLALLVAEGT